MADALSSDAEHAAAVSRAVTSWPESQPPTDVRAVVVLLHGFGSHEHDLAELGGRLPAGFAWASLRAPVEMPHGGASWFPIDTPGDPAAAPVEASTRGILAWLDANVPAGVPIVPFGFSQGALMASQLRTAPGRVAATVMLAGFVLAHPQPADDELASALPPVFSGRGDADRVIPAEAVARTDAWLPAHATLERHLYAALTHGISGEEMADVVAFIDREA